MYLKVTGMCDMASCHLTYTLSDHTLGNKMAGKRTGTEQAKLQACLFTLVLWYHCSHDETREIRKLGRTECRNRHGKDHTTLLHRITRHSDTRCLMAGQKRGVLQCVVGQSLLKRWLACLQDYHCELLRFDSVAPVNIKTHAELYVSKHPLQCTLFRPHSVQILTQQCGIAGSYCTQALAFLALISR